MSDHLAFEVSRDSWTGKLQLAISKLDDDGVGDGYRLAGPKFNGSSVDLLTCKLSERDAREIRAYLDAVFPVSGAVGAQRRSCTEPDGRNQT